MEWVSAKPLWILLALLPVVWAFRQTLVDRPRILRALAFGLRILSVLLLILALCRPYWSTDSKDLHVVFLVDVSESVDLEAAQTALQDVRMGIDRLGRGDSWSLFWVADGIRPIENLDAAEAQMQQWLDVQADHQFGRASRLSEALRSVRLCFPAQKARRVVLLTDGRDTHEDMTMTLTTLEKEHIDVQIRKLDGLQKPEAALVSLSTNTPNAFQGEIVRFTVEAVTNQPVTGKLRLLHRGVAMTETPVTLDPKGPNRLVLDVEMTTPGANHWTAELIPDHDHFPINNQLSCTVTVGGKPRVLVLHERPRDMRPWQRALVEQDLDVDIRSRNGMPESLEAMLAFDIIVLADIAATDISPYQMRTLNRYVTDFGRGLVMMGSNNSYGLGGYYKTPIEDVLPLTSRYEKEKEQPSVALVLVIDKSGSMQGMPIELARQAAQATVELMGMRDQIGVVGFDSQPLLVCELHSGSDPETVKDAIQTLAAGGGTNMYPGMAMAYEMLERASAKVKHVIVLSDGHSQRADHEGLAADMVAAGITLSTVALGQADHNLLASLAEIGHGRYYATDDPSSIPQIFTKETVETSRSAVKEDVYTPVQVTDHPLLSGVTEAELPLVLGYVMTQAKPATQVLLVTDSGDPLMAVSRYGLGSSLAYTSDMTERWGGEWLVWPQCGRFWAQALRSMVRRDTTEGVTVNSACMQGRWQVDIGRTNAAGEPINGLQWEAQLVDGERTTDLTVAETGLGRYQLHFLWGNSDRLTLRLRDPEHDNFIIRHYAKPYPAEYNLDSRTPPILEQLTPYQASTLKQNLTPIPIRKPVSHVFYLLSLVALLAGMLFRRV